MKQFNLDEYLKDSNKKIITRDGKSVKILCTNLVSDKPVVAQIKGTGYSLSYPKDGKCSACQDSIDDLFFASGEHREGWVNIYRNKTNGESYCGKIYESEDDAKSQTDILTTIKIEWEE